MLHIKFRAWDKTKNVMEDDVPVWNRDVVELEREDDGEVFHTDWGIIQGVEVMQYSGLKDKNGKLVCEGDILKDDYGRVLVVELWDHGFVFRAVTETNFKHAKDITEWFDGVTQPPEIIGNIYENPGLIK